MFGCCNDKMLVLDRYNALIQRGNERLTETVHKCQGSAAELETNSTACSGCSIHIGLRQRLHAAYSPSVKEIDLWLTKPQISAQPMASKTSLPY